MKHLIKFSLFEEINPKDISHISEEFDKYFTVSFEFEIETAIRTDMKINFEDFDEEMIDEISDIAIKNLEISKIEDRRRKLEEKNLIKTKLYEFLDYIESESISIEIFHQIFDTSSLPTKREKDLISHIKMVVLSFIAQEDLIYLKKQVKKYLPNFTTKWDRKIDYVGDPTLERGIEIKPKKYVKSISESIELINDFYNDLMNQKYFKFTERTGLHINIGTNVKIEYNPIKGLLLLNDYSKNEDIPPLVFRDMDWRLNNKFCGSLIPSLMSLPDSTKKELKDSIDLKNVKDAENKLNRFLTSKVEEWGHKNYGFNITKIKEKYVEFRYAGGEMPKEILIDKVKYFCFLVYCMTNPEYKKKEYLKKLYKFIESL